MGIQRYNFGRPLETPYADRPEASGISRKLKTPHPTPPALLRSRILPVASALQIWAAVPDPLTWAYRKPAGAHGS